jgi:hypothetical protein
MCTNTYNVFTIPHINYNDTLIITYNPAEANTTVLTAYCADVYESISILLIPKFYHFYILNTWIVDLLRNIFLY